MFSGTAGCHGALLRVYMKDRGYNLLNALAPFSYILLSWSLNIEPGKSSCSDLRTVLSTITCTSQTEKRGGLRSQIFTALFPPPVSLRVSETLYSGPVQPMFPFCRSINASSSERTLCPGTWKALSILDTSEPQLPWRHTPHCPWDLKGFAHQVRPHRGQALRSSSHHEHLHLREEPSASAWMGSPSTGVPGTGTELPSSGNRHQDDLPIPVSGEGEECVSGPQGPRLVDPRGGSGTGGRPAGQLAWGGGRAGDCVHAVSAPATDAAGDKPLLCL